MLQDDFIPKDVAHRDPEVNRISNALAAITDGDSGETTFLFGPSGVGKTCLAQFVTERLREQILDLETCYSGSEAKAHPFTDGMKPTRWGSTHRSVVRGEL